jgi:hypothetical protein
MAEVSWQAQVEAGHNPHPATILKISSESTKNTRKVHGDGTLVSFQIVNPILGLVCRHSSRESSLTSKAYSYHIHAQMDMYINTATHTHTHVQAHTHTHIHTQYTYTQTIHSHTHIHSYNTHTIHTHTYTQYTHTHTQISFKFEKCVLPLKVTAQRAEGRGQRVSLEDIWCFTFQIPEIKVFLRVTGPLLTIIFFLRGTKSSGKSYICGISTSDATWRATFP